MTGWRQAVFIRQRRIDVIQRALSKILDEETWSPATPRRLHVGTADASSRGWTMIVPQLADFFLDHGGTGAPRLCRLAEELRSPAYEVDVRDPDTTTLFEANGLETSAVSGVSVLPASDEQRARIAALAGAALADYLGALVGFPGWTRHGEAGFAAGALIYEPPSFAAAGVRSRSPETRGASARTTPRAAPPSHDRRGTRPRSASRPRR
ncbi:MAG: hypothetical protein ABIY55_30775 [Kofleriaceae bacterium]